MKFLPLILALLCCSVALARVVEIQRQPVLGQLPTNQVEIILERGPHHKVVNFIEPVVTPLGELVSVTNSYIQLETGLNYQGENGAWIESVPQFETSTRGATFSSGQHRVNLAGNLNSAGAIQLRLPSGEWMIGHIAGLAYFDASSGTSVMFAPVKDSEGWQVQEDQIVYPDAFKGTRADVRYTVSRSGFEQDVILREVPPAPASYGMNPITTRIEVWTEFTTAPIPSIRRSRNHLARRIPQETDEEHDQVVDFGSMRIGEGRAFTLGGDRQDQGSVQKHWIQTDTGRTFLVEAVDVSQVSGALEALPRRTDGTKLTPEVPHARLQALNAIPQPKSRSKESRSPQWHIEDQRLLADLRRPGLVMDYQISLVGGGTNFTFKGDTTYLVSGVINLLETTTIEGGTVVKFSGISSNNDVRINVTGPLICKTDQYRPAVFTAIDDNSIGEKIFGSTGIVVSDYASIGLQLSSATNAYKLEYLRFTALNSAVLFSSTLSNCVAHSQFIKCRNSFVNYGTNSVGVYNALIDNAQQYGYVFHDGGVGCKFFGYNLTINAAPNLRTTAQGTGLDLNNSILSSVGTSGGQTYSGYSNFSTNTTTGVFQTTLAGRFYSAEGSPTRGIGYPINPALLAPFARMTTRPPMLLTNSFSSHTTLYPIVKRQTNGTPDIGYHYPVIDYMWTRIGINNATLTLTNGVAVAFYGPSGISLSGSASLVSGGRPNRINQLTTFNAIQEQPEAWITNIAAFSIISGLPRVDARFTDVSLMSAGNGGRSLSTVQVHNEAVQFRDSSLRGVYWKFYNNIESGYQVPSQSLVNCWFDRSELNWIQGSDVLDQQYYLTLSIRNCAFHNTKLNLKRASTYYGYWTIVDNLFNGVNPTINYYTGYSVPDSVGYNGAITNTVNPFGGSGNRSSLLPDFQAGPLGPWYYPVSGATNSLASLIDADTARTAGSAGLFNHSTGVNLVKDGATSSALDIGFHYVTTDSDGVPLDCDGDTLPDYVEDANGNGIVNGAESDMCRSLTIDGSRIDLLPDGTPFPIGDGLADILELQIGSNPNSSDTDGDGIEDFDEYWNGTNPLAGGDIPAQRLDHWSFDTLGVASDNGAAPTSNTAILAQSYDGLAACITNSSSKLTYPTVVSLGGTNRPTISFWNGTVRLSYVSDWGINGDSSKPNQWARLLECGDWKLSIDPQGSNLVFQSPVSTGGTRTNMIARIPWMVSGAGRKQCDITLTYGPGFCRAVIKSGTSTATTDGEYGVHADVPVAVKSAGFTVGNSATGGSPALGCIDDLETFACQADPDWPDRSNVRFARFYDPILRRANALSASIVTNGIRLKWVRGWEGDWQTNAQLYGISRRIAGSDSSFTTMASGIVTNSWVDTSGSPGVYYEYRIDRFSTLAIVSHPVIVASLAGSMIDQRGRAILMIDQTLTNALWSDFEAYKRQLAADGWAVTNYYVPRHFDPPLSCATYDTDATAGWVANVNNMATIKNIIRREYTNNLTSTNVVILVGHVPIPHSGLIPEDGHPDHWGAWTTDAWYGEMTAQWGDSSVNYTNSTFCMNNNRPNDGRFDADSIPFEQSGSPGRIEMGVGRIDFSNLPVHLTAGTFPGVVDTAGVEVKSLQRYFGKTLRYRRAEIGFLREARSWQGDGSFHGGIGAHQWINTRAFGSEAFDTAPRGTDLFLVTTNFLFGMHSDFGFFNEIGHNQMPLSRRHTSLDIVQGDQVPRGMFVFLDGSYMNDWYRDDSILRTCLGMSDTALVLLWGRNHIWRTDRFSAGSAAHTILQDTFAAGVTTNSKRSLHGDPTLREQYIAPVSSFSAGKSGVNVVLSWANSAAADMGYRIYWASGTNTTSWSFLAALPPSSISFTTSALNPSTNAYLIRAIGLRQSGSGSLSVSSFGAVAPNEVKFP
jgi:Bacterial TSP3 repeat